MPSRSLSPHHRTASAWVMKFSGMPPRMGPPLTAKVCPVTYAAASLTRKWITLATSIGRPTRRRGIVSAIAALSIPAAFYPSSDIFETINPTAMLLIRIPNRPHSAADTVVNMLSADLAAE